MYNTYAHQINRVKTLLDGLTANGADVAQLGLTADFVKNLTDLYTQAGQLEEKCNQLKSDSQQATATQIQNMKNLNKQCSVARKSIRVALPKEHWPAFGFRAGETRVKTTGQTPVAMEQVGTVENSNLQANV